MKASEEFQYEVKAAGLLTRAEREVVSRLASMQEGKGLGGKARIWVLDMLRFRQLRKTDLYGPTV